MMKRTSYISVSVMCSDLMSLGYDICKLDRYGVDMLHVDVMDAHFVPNLTFGPDFIKSMRRITNLPLDIHLMVENPELVMKGFELREGDYLTVHVELDRDYTELAARVKAAGAHFGIAVSPDTPVSAIERHKGLFELVLLMLVHPGYAGAKMVEGIMDKVGETRRWLDANGLEDVLIGVDGSVSCERAAYMKSLGASLFVGGTAGIYRKGMKLEDTIPAFRKSIE